VGQAFATEAIAECIRSCAAPFTKEELIDGIADCVAALLAQRDEKIAELGGKLDAVLQILGTGKSDDIIIDLPKNFWRRDAA
jgi:hypothetical protein